MIQRPRLHTDGIAKVQHYAWGRQRTNAAALGNVCVGHTAGTAAAGGPAAKGLSRPFPGGAGGAGKPAGEQVRFEPPLSKID